MIVTAIPAGFAAGLFGIGGGAVMVPAMVVLLGMTQHNAQGTSIGLMLLPIGGLAAYNYYAQGQLNVKYGAIIAVAFFVGGYFGSKMSLGISEVWLKRAFGILMLFIAVKMIASK